MTTFMPYAKTTFREEILHIEISLTYIWCKAMFTKHCAITLHAIYKNIIQPFSTIALHLKMQKLKPTLTFNKMEGFEKVFNLRQQHGKYKNLSLSSNIFQHAC